MIGRVVSAKMQKTVAVLVEGQKTHPLYKKTYAWSKKYLVRDEIGAKVGDVVVISPTRPISKRVHFKINKILGADVVALGEAAMKQVEQDAIEEVMPVEEETNDNSQPLKEGRVESGEKTEAELVTEKKETKAKKPKAKKEAKS